MGYRLEVHTAEGHLESHHGDGNYDEVADAIAAALDALSDPNEEVTEVRLVKTTG